MKRALGYMALVLLAATLWGPAASLTDKIPKQPMAKAEDSQFVITGYTLETTLHARDYLRQEMARRIEAALRLEFADRDRFERYREGGGITANQFLCKHRI